MKQTNQESIDKAVEILTELKAKRGGTLVEFHKRMANDPDLIKAFSQMYDLCKIGIKNIPEKYVELIIFAIGCAMNAPVTIDVHSQAAIKKGATVEELGEVLRLVFFLCGVPGLTAGLSAFEPLNFEQDI